MTDTQVTPTTVVLNVGKYVARKVLHLTVLGAVTQVSLYAGKSYMDFVFGSATKVNPE